MAHDHRVDLVDRDGKDRPENGRQEEAADDIDYIMVREEAGCGAALRAATGEAFEP